jgi:hypothetical protein
VTSKDLLARCAAAALALSVGGCASAPGTAFNKPGITAEQMEQEEAACLHPGAPPAAPVNPSGSTAGAIAGTTAAAAANGYEQTRTAYDFGNCMEAKGYRRIHLTPAQDTAMRSMNAEQRKAFMTKIYIADSPEAVTP